MLIDVAIPGDKNMSENVKAKVVPGKTWATEPFHSHSDNT